MSNINTWYWRLYQRIKHNNKIDPTAWISNKVYLGNNITIGAYCIIGANAEHKTKWGVNKGVQILDKTIITGVRDNDLYLADVKSDDSMTPFYKISSKLFRVK